MTFYCSEDVSALVYSSVFIVQNYTVTITTAKKNVIAMSNEHKRMIKHILN